MTTVGLIFLGTPFRGSKMQFIADLIAQIMQPVGSYRGIIKDLAYDGVTLWDKLHSFCRLRNKLSTPVSCFYELYETDCGRRLGIGRVFKGMVCSGDE